MRSFEHIYGFSIDNLIQIISTVAYHIRKNKEEWTPLKAEYFRAIVPQADQYTKILRELDIIERSGNPKKGERSYNYRFTEGHQSKFIQLPFTNPKIINRIKKHQTAMRKRNSKMYPFQNKYIRQMTIEPEALQFAYQIYTDNLHSLYNFTSTYAMDIKRQKYFEKEEKKITRRYNYSVALILKIMYEPPKMTVDSTSGRYHSNLTNLPKELRQFIRINGKRLVNLDVKNSQPYLSTLILTDPRKVAEFTKNPHFSMLLRSLHVIHTEDIERYVSLVIQGRLYEYLISEYESRGFAFRSTDFKEKRNQMKKLVLQIIYDKNVRNPKCRRIFAELFPEVHRVFSIVRGDVKTEDKFQNYKRFAILLQRIESRLILNRVLGRLSIEHPDVIAVTVHDSVMTVADEEHVRIVHRMMEEELQKFVGFPPTLKFEDNFI